MSRVGRARVASLLLKVLCNRIGYSIGCGICGNLVTEANSEGSGLGELCRSLKLGSKLLVNLELEWGAKLYRRSPDLGKGWLGFVILLW